jgi:hypothetical protein
MARSHITRVHTGLNAILVVATALACSSAPDTTTGPRLRVPDPLFTEEDANPVVASLTGHWEVVGSAGNLNKLSVNALQRRDGTVTGELQFERISPDRTLLLKAHGDVICLGVDGNTARVAVVGEQVDLTTGATTTGYGYVTAIDSGEGANDPPDRGSNLFGTSSEQVARSHCTTPLIPDARLFPIERGNVQVRSGT